MPMRVLSISHRLQHRQVDNHTIFNAPALFDYDAIVIDAGRVFTTIRGAIDASESFMTYADIPVVNGESLDGVAGIAEVLKRRREELTRALEHGATVTVFLYPPTILSGIVGMPAIDRYFYLPAPPGISWDATTIRGGEGNAGALVDHDHPFAKVWDVLRRDVLYRAHIDERAPGIAGHIKTFVRSPGGAAIGAEFRVLNGRIVFLPTPKQEGATWLIAPLAHAFVDAMHASLGRDEDDRPRWVLDLSLPGLAALEDAEARTRAAADRALAEHEEAAAAVRERGLIRDVLWQGSEQGLLPAVVRCLETIGFELGRSTDGDSVIRDGKDEVHFVVAASREAVDMAPHYRLRARLDALLEKRARAARGIVFVNGQRQTRPQDRKREFTDSLRVAAEALGYAVVTTPTLFDAASAALDGIGPEVLEAVRRRLLTETGVITLDDLLWPEDAADLNADSEAAAPSDDLGAAAEPEDASEREADGAPEPAADAEDEPPEETEEPTEPAPTTPSRRTRGRR